MDTMVIGIAGGTGSGKTTLTRSLKDTFGDDVSVIYHDNYYKAHHDLTYDQRAALNYDHPDAFDTALMVAGIRRLLAGETIRCPVYDYTVHDRSDRTTPVEPTKVEISATVPDTPEWISEETKPPALPTTVPTYT